MRSERGESLIEVMIAIVIIAVAITAVIGALIASLTASAQHRTLAVEDALMRSAAEQIDQEAGQAYGCTYAITQPSDADYHVAISHIESGSINLSQSVASRNSWESDGSCNKGTGIERVTVTASYKGGLTQTLSFVVRNPAYNAPNA